MSTQVLKLGTSTLQQFIRTWWFLNPGCVFSSRKYSSTHIIYYFIIQIFKISFKRALEDWDSLSQGFCLCRWTDILLEPQDAKRSQKNVTLCFARVEKISQVPQKVVSQTSFSCLKSRDLSANGGCAQTDRPVYQAGFSRDSSTAAERKWKSDSTVDKYHLTWRHHPVFGSPAHLSKVEMIIFRKGREAVVCPAGCPLRLMVPRYFKNRSYFLFEASWGNRNLTGVQHWCQSSSNSPVLFFFNISYSRTTSNNLSTPIGPWTSVWESLHHFTNSDIFSKIVTGGFF